MKNQMKPMLILTFILCSFIAVSQTAAEFNKLVHTVFSSEAAIEDFKSLRHLYVETDNYNPYDNDLSRNIRAAYENEDYELVIKLIDENIATNFVSFDLHFFAMKTFQALNKPELHRWHGYVAFGLSDSIMEGVDGKTPENAFRVINVREEYIVMNFLKVKLLEQAFVKIKGTPYDVMSVESIRTGEKFDLYFNTEYPSKWLKGNMLTTEKNE